MVEDYLEVCLVLQIEEALSCAMLQRTKAGQGVERKGN
jgi:hypothetical protein